MAAHKGVLRLAEGEDEGTGPAVVIPDMAHFDWARPGDARYEKVLETIDGWLNDVWG